MMVKVKLFIVCWVLLAAGKGFAQKNVDVVSYVNTYKALAVSEMQRTGVPASIILAQGIHETEAGTSDLVRRSNNHFGIKCKDDWTGERVYHDDDARGECFRSYPTPADSYRDHSDFLRNRPYYASLFNLDPTDYAAWAIGLRKAGYATNPKYSQILIKLIEDYNLEQYTLIAMGRIKVSEEVVLTAPGASNNAPLRDAGIVTGTSGDVSAKPAEVAVSDPAAPDSSGYPQSEFMINKTRVIYVRAGVSLLSVAEQYDLPLARLLEFNDMKEEDILTRGQLLFLQRKRRIGGTEYHTVRQGESLYDISQAEGVRFQDLLELNQLSPGVQPAAGERIYLQSTAPSRPQLTSGRSVN